MVGRIVGGERAAGAASDPEAAREDGTSGGGAAGEPPAGTSLPPLPDLVCLRCGAGPETALAWNRAQGQLVHTVQAAPGAGGLPRICGGLVVPRGMERVTQAYAPGDVALCFPDTHSIVPHLVRLGPPVRRAPGWWHGTPMCGTPHLLRATWTPLVPAVGKATDPCGTCRKARDKGEIL